jgi:putative nucleotidyltransferase with HDIG domain
MRVARTVATSNGKVLLTMGTVLRESYIEPLQKQGLIAIYIVNDLAPDVTAPEVVPDAARQTLQQELALVVDQLRPTLTTSGRDGIAKMSVGLDGTRLTRTVEAVVNHLMSNPRVVFNLKDIRSADEYTLGHSASVSILAMLLGTVVGYNASELNGLGMGALLHDIGKTATPPEILNKPGPLTPEEYTVMCQHPTVGWHLLREQREVRSTAAIVALQHHERWEGGGYPQGLRGEQIYKHSRICAVADCFDAMTSDRPYRKGLSSAVALEVLQESMRGHFDPAVLFSFTQCVAPYPVGSLVEVTGGQQAVVVSVTRGHTYRPRLRLVRGSDGRALPGDRELELREHPDVRILRLLQETSGEYRPEDLETEG